MELLSFSLAQALRMAVLWVAATYADPLLPEVLVLPPEEGSRSEAVSVSDERTDDESRPNILLGGGAVAPAKQTSGSEPDAPQATERRAPRAPRSMEDLAFDDDNFDVLGFVQQSLPIATHQVATTRGPATLSLHPVPGSGTGSCFVVEVEVNSPTPFFEFFVAQVPLPNTGAPVPLVVLFHEFGRTHKAALTTTTFFEAACTRGWFVVSPLGASTKHFSSIESQQNTEVVLDWMVQRFPSQIDRERIYGVGFSMGGGAVVNYAARHLDPSKPMFAGIVALSGAPSQKDVYRKETAGIRFIFDFWFGDGSPDSADEWEMERSSCVSFDPDTVELEAVEHLGQNLLHVPTHLWLAEFDPIEYVNVQNEALRDLLTTVGAPLTYTIVPGSTEHTWDLLPPDAALDWFEPLRLASPLSGRTVADRDGYYYHFLIEQEATGAFTPFEWRIDAAANAVEVIGSTNLGRFTVDIERVPLDATSPLLLHLQANDAADSARLLSFPAYPQDVRRDGVSVAMGNGWDYSPATKQLTIDETDPGAHTWEILP